MIPAIDHGLLSPSGHMSKRARNAALERERARLFPAGFWDKPEPSATDITTRERERALFRARMLGELAKRGMHPIKYRKEADRLERDWL